MRLVCATYGIIDKYSDFINQEYSSIVGGLSDTDVVVDFYDYEVEDDDRQYVAFVYRGDYEAPLLLKVCKESNINEIFKEVTALSYANGEQFDFSEVYNPELEYSNKLYSCIMGQVVERVNIDSSFNLYVIPSGSLHKIPIESLVVSEESKCIVSDYYKSIVRLSHAREIINRNHPRSLSNIALFGGFDYGCNEEKSSDVTENRGYRISYENGRVTPLKPWKELIYSAREIDGIAIMWKYAKGGDLVVKYTGSEGTADNFYEMNEKDISVIHFATHGFFETQESAVNLPALKGRFAPMDLTGIVMSNGNKGWLHGSPTKHEGIITASDIAKMDLRNTSFVVLSVCNSGNGTVRSDEFYGLQRAFKKAGVKSIVMSLWNEADDSGEMFMTRLYNHLLFDNFSLTDSFNMAKNEVRDYYHHPIYWANFVLID